MNFLKKTKVDFAIVFVIAFLIRCLCYMRSIGYTMRTDDFGPLIYPAYLAGFDWKNFYGDTPYYYGYGYYWLFAPLFALISNFRVLLLSMVWINNVLICATCLLVYHILREYFEMPRKWYTILLAVIASFFVGDVPTKAGSNWYRTDNEIPFYFIIWIVVWLVLKVNRETDRKKRFLGSFFMGLCLVWALTVHERALSLVIAVAAIEVYLFLCKHKWLYNPIAALITVVPGYFIHKMVQSNIVDYFWGSGANKKNTDAFASISIDYILSEHGIKGFATVFLGNLHSLFIKSYAIPVFAIIILIIWIGKNGLISQLITKLRKKNVEAVSELPEPTEIIMMIMGVTFLIILIGMSVNWGGKLGLGFENGEMVYAYKGICYSRYYFMTIGPLICSTIAYYSKRELAFMKMDVAAIALIGVIELAFVAIVLPIIFNTESQYMARASNLSILKHNNFKLSFLIMIICAMVFAFSVKLKKLTIKGAHVVIVIIMLCTLANRFLYINPAESELRFIATDKTDEVLDKITESGMKTPDTMYVDRSEAKRFNIQFMLKDKNMIHGLPSKDCKTILFSEVYIDKMINERGFRCFRLSKNWYGYTNIEDYYPVFEEYEEIK